MKEKVILFQTPDKQLVGDEKDLWSEMLARHSQNLADSILPAEVTADRAMLRQANLKGAVLHNCSLGSSWLERANMSFCLLYRPNLSNTDFRRANLSKVCAYKAIMTGADLRDADLRGALFEGCDLRGADLRGARLEGTNFQNSDLRGANLQNAVYDDDTTIWPKGCRPDQEGVLTQDDSASTNPVPAP